MSSALKPNSLSLSNKRLQHLPTIVRGVSVHLEPNSAHSDETTSTSPDAAEEISKTSSPETSRTVSWNRHFRDFDERQDAMSSISSNREYINNVTRGQDYFTDNHVN